MGLEAGLADRLTPEVAVGEAPGRVLRVVARELARVEPEQAGVAELEEPVPELAQELVPERAQLVLAAGPVQALVAQRFPES